MGFYLRPLVDRGSVQAGLDSIFSLGRTTNRDRETSCFANYLMGNSRRWEGYVEWVYQIWVIVESGDLIWGIVESGDLNIGKDDQSWRKTENLNNHELLLRSWGKSREMREKCDVVEKEGEEIVIKFWLESDENRKCDKHRSRRMEGFWSGGTVDPHTGGLKRAECWDCSGRGVC